MLLQRKIVHLLGLSPLLLGSALITSSASTLSSSSISEPTCISQPITPIQIPIRNVTLNDDTLRRGAAVSIGSPPEDFAFSINPRYNNTYINDGTVPACGTNDTRQQCSNQFGGLFDEGNSSTWSLVSNFSALGTANEGVTDQTGDLWGTDTLKLNSTLSLPTFPLGIMRGSGDMINTLGLGQNSTLLSALVSSGAIASRTWSMFQGWTGADTQYQMDGSVVLGGYDAAKITGENITQSFAPADNCINGYVISVTGLMMNLKNGSAASIMDPAQGSEFQACIEPGLTTMTLSENEWWRFTNISESPELGRSLSPIHFFGMLVSAQGAYDGDLTFSVNKVLDITIPNHQLIVPDYEINSEGEEYPSNSSVLEVLINSLQNINENDMARLGQPFLSSAYLMVDNDKEQFTLWQSKPVTTSNIVAIGPPACSPPATTAASPTPKPLSSVIAPAVHLPPPAKSVPKGAIVGGVIGGIAAIALGLGAFFLQNKRRGQGRPALLQQDYAAKDVYDPHYSDVSTMDKPEMPTDRQPPLELPLVKDPGYSVAPYEMPATPRPIR